MIANQSKGAGFHGTLAYVLEKEQAELLYTNMLGTSVKELSSEFAQARRLRPNLKKCVYHASLSLPPEETLNNTQWQEISNKYMEKMGFTNSQFVAVLHKDTDHQHIHIVASRIGLDGRVVSDSNDYRRSEKIIRGLELDYGLQQVTPSRETEIAAPTQGELRKILKEGTPSIKMRLQQIIGDATTEKQSMTQFIEKLESKGVGVKANISKTTGNITGVSFVLDGEQMKGSDLGKGYTWGGLKKKGIEYDVNKESQRVLTAGQSRYASSVQRTYQGNELGHTRKDKTIRQAYTGNSGKSKNRNGGKHLGHEPQNEFYQGANGRHRPDLLEDREEHGRDSGVTNTDERKYHKKSFDRSTFDWAFISPSKHKGVLFLAREILREREECTKMGEVSREATSTDAPERSEVDSKLSKELDTLLKPYDDKLKSDKKQIELERKRQRSLGMEQDGGLSL